MSWGTQTRRLNTIGLENVGRPRPAAGIAGAGAGAAAIQHTSLHDTLWQCSLSLTHSMLSDLHWTPAVIDVSRAEIADFNVCMYVCMYAYLLSKVKLSPR
jgi:hypothetical protein